MNLHRVERQPDWNKIPHDRHNVFQRQALATKGVITPGNLLTFVGFGLAVYGLVLVLNESYWLGLICLAVGRLLDIADGYAADRTGTKSPLGELLDAGFDKLITVLTIAVLFWVSATIRPLLLALLLPQVITALLAFYEAHVDRRLHPSAIGKLSMALAWVSLVMMVLRLASLDNDLFPLINILTYVLSIASTLTGLVAFAGYWRFARKAK